jgi:hypothetical protein
VGVPPLVGAARGVRLRHLRAAALQRVVQRRQAVLLLPRCAGLPSREPNAES